MASGTVECKSLRQNIGGTKSRCSTYWWKLVTLFLNMLKLISCLNIEEIPKCSPLF